MIIYLEVPNSFFSAFLWGVICITPSLVVLAIFPRVDTFLFDKNLGYFQVKIWKPFRKEEFRRYPLETINRVEIEKYQSENVEIRLILDEGQKRVYVYLNHYYGNVRKGEEHAKAIARFLNVRNYE